MTNLTIIDLDVAEMVETSACYCNGHEWYASNRNHIVSGPTWIRISTPIEELVKRTARAMLIRTESQIRSAELRLDNLARERHNTLRLVNLFVRCGRTVPDSLLLGLQNNAKARVLARAVIVECLIELSQM